MTLTKETVQGILSTFKGDIDHKELIYKINFMAELRAASADIDAGNGIPQEEIEKWVESWPEE